MRWINISLILMLFVGLSQAESIRGKVKKGNELFKQGKYEQALSAYQDALLDDPLNEIALLKLLYLKTVNALTLAPITF